MRGGESHGGLGQKSLQQELLNQDCEWLEGGAQPVQGPGGWSPSRCPGWQLGLRYHVLLPLGGTDAWWGGCTSCECDPHICHEISWGECSAHLRTMTCQGCPACGAQVQLHIPARAPRWNGDLSHVGPQDQPFPVGASCGLWGSRASVYMLTWGVQMVARLWDRFVTGGVSANSGPSPDLPGGLGPETMSQG